MSLLTFRTIAPFAPGYLRMSESRRQRPAQVFVVSAGPSKTQARAVVVWASSDAPRNGLMGDDGSVALFRRSRIFAAARWTIAGATTGPPGTGCPFSSRLHGR